MSAGVPLRSESTKCCAERTKPAPQSASTSRNSVVFRLVLVAGEQHHRREVEHLAGGAGDPDLPLVARDLEELVGPVVARTHVEPRCVLDLHRPEHHRVLVLEDGGTRLHEQVAPPHHRLHGGDVEVEQPQRHGVLVHHVVEEVAARAARVEPPAVPLGTEVGLEGRVGLPDQGADAQTGRPPDGAVGHQLLGQLDRRVVDEALADAERPTGSFRRRAHCQGVLNGVGRGLLHRDVLAGLQAPPGRGHDGDRWA